MSGSVCGVLYENVVESICESGYRRLLDDAIPSSDESGKPVFKADANLKWTLSDPHLALAYSTASLPMSMPTTELDPALNNLSLP